MDGILDACKRTIELSQVFEGSVGQVLGQVMWGHDRGGSKSQKGCLKEQFLTLGVYYSYAWFF